MNENPFIRNSPSNPLKIFLIGKRSIQFAIDLLHKMKYVIRSSFSERSVCLQNLFVCNQASLKAKSFKSDNRQSSKSRLLSTKLKLRYKFHAEVNDCLSGYPTDLYGKTLFINTPIRQFYQLLNLNDYLLLSFFICYKRSGIIFISTSMFQTHATSIKLVVDIGDVRQETLKF